MNALMRGVYAAVQNNVRAHVAIRVSVVCSGMGLHSLLANSHSFMRLVGLVEKDVDPFELPKAKDYGLFFLQADNPCPIHRLAIADWLVRGVEEWTGVENFPFHTIAPETWVQTVESAFDSMPDEYRTDEAANVVMAIAGSLKDEHGKQRLKEITEALRIKGQAIEAGYDLTNCHELIDNSTYDSHNAKKMRTH